MRWLHFILSHSIFISICAVALCFQTYLLLHIPYDNNVYGFIFFSTLSSYNFYWLISKYYFNRKDSVIAFLKNNITYTVLFFIAAGGMIFFSIFLYDALIYICFAILLTLLYSLPLWPFRISAFARQAGFLKTTLLAFTWAYVTVIIPAAPLFSIDIGMLLLFIARFFFMLMLCIIFDTRDISVDKIHALRSLATDVSMKGLRSIMLVAFILYLAAGLLVRYHFRDNEQLVAFIANGIIVWIVYKASLQKQGYIFYYFVVDGLMLLSAAATYLASIS